nr:hypothetical protein [Tanacetum cinerariifolium]
MIQLDYVKLNALYDTFVPQKEPSAEQTYFSTPSTSTVSCESSKEILDVPTQKIPNESKLLKSFVKLDEAVLALQTNIDITLLKDSKRSRMHDGQDTLRKFYKTDVILMELSLIKRSKELKQEVTEEVYEMLYIFEEIRECVLISVAEEKNEILMLEKEKISNDSKDIQANLLKRIKILENDFKRSQAQSINFELKMQHQKQKMAFDIFWKSRLSKLNDENVLLKTQVDSAVQERENMKLEYQKLFNSIKETRVQHQHKVSELIENFNQKTYAYGDVRFKNQDLLMIIFELKDKLKTIVKGKDVNTKFDKSETLGNLLCLTLLNKNTAIKDKKCSNTEGKKSLFTSHVAAKSRNLGANSVVAKSRLSVSKTQETTNKVIQIVLWIVDSGCSKHMIEYYATSTPEVSAANALEKEDTPSSLSIVIEEDEAPQIVTSSKEPVANEPINLVLNENADELAQTRCCRT